MLRRAVVRRASSGPALGKAFIYLFIAGLFGRVLLGLVGSGIALIAIPVLTFPLPHLGVPEAQAPMVALATSMGPRWGSRPSGRTVR